MIAIGGIGAGWGWGRAAAPGSSGVGWSCDGLVDARRSPLTGMGSVLTGIGLGRSFCRQRRQAAAAEAGHVMRLSTLAAHRPLGSAEQMPVSGWSGPMFARRGSCGILLCSVLLPLMGSGTVCACLCMVSAVMSNVVYTFGKGCMRCVRWTGMEFMTRS